MRCMVWFYRLWGCCRSFLGERPTSNALDAYRPTGHIIPNRMADSMDSELAQNLVTRVAMGDIFRRRDRTTPDRIALVEKRGGEKIHLTYRELNDRLNRFARGIRGLGLKKGDGLRLFV